MANIGQAVGGALQSLPIDKMISAPLMAAIAAQVRASHAYKEFVETVGLENGKAVMIPFEYEEDIIDEAGNVVDTRVRKMSVPLLALVSHPNLNVEEVQIDFEMTIETSEEDHSSTSGEGGFEAKIGWGPFSVKVHGKVSHKSEQTRKTDTRAKYSISVLAKRAGPPEGMMRVLDAMVDEATRAKKSDGQPALPTPNADQ
jgi:hypothetical protein